MSEQAESRVPWKQLHRNTLVKLLHLEERYERLRKAAEPFAGASAWHVAGSVNGTPYMGGAIEQKFLQELRAALAEEGK